VQIRSAEGRLGDAPSSTRAPPLAAAANPRRPHAAAAGGATLLLSCSERAAADVGSASKTLQGSRRIELGQLLLLDAAVGCCDRAA